MRSVFRRAFQEGEIMYLIGAAVMGFILGYAVQSLIQISSNVDDTDYLNDYCEELEEIVATQRDEIRNLRNRIAGNDKKA